jgi:AraC-like DNA-binding protein
VRTLSLAPHKLLRPYVLSYHIVEDLEGKHAGEPIRTCPEPIGVLSVNFGRPSFHESGKAHPKVALLGIQTRVRQWVSQAETLFVMAMLTVPGIFALFPEVGGESADNLLDIADFWGDKETNRFSGSFPDKWEPDTIKAAMDNILLDATFGDSNRKKVRRLNMYQSLMTHQRIDLACEHLGMSSRSMQREFRQHLGISPKQLLNLQRFQHSLKVNAAGVQESLDTGFSDQAHEIRTWRKYLDCTPGRYKAKGRSIIASSFASKIDVSSDQPVFYL